MQPNWQNHYIFMYTHCPTFEEQEYNSVFLLSKNPKQPKKLIYPAKSLLVVAKYILFYSPVLYKSTVKNSYNTTFSFITINLIPFFFLSITHLHAAEYDICINLKLDIVSLLCATTSEILVGHYLLRFFKITARQANVVGFSLLRFVDNRGKMPP